MSTNESQIYRSISPVLPQRRPFQTARCFYLYRILLRLSMYVCMIANYWILYTSVF